MFSNEELMNAFLNNCWNYLNINSQNFMQRLRAGDVGSIKLLIETTLKTYEGSRKKAEKAGKKRSGRVTTITEGMDYETAFELLKESLQEPFEENEEY